LLSRIAAQAGQFEGLSRTIQTQFKQVASSLNEVTPALVPAVQSFESTLNAVKSQLAPVLKSMEMRHIQYMQNSGDGSSTNSSGKAPAAGVKKVISVSVNGGAGKVPAGILKDPAVQQMQKHLSKK
jgi:hypothetical protein